MAASRLRTHANADTGSAARTVERSRSPKATAVAASRLARTTRPNAALGDVGAAADGAEGRSLTMPVIARSVGDFTFCWGEDQDEDQNQNQNQNGDQDQDP